MAVVVDSNDKKYFFLVKEWINLFTTSFLFIRVYHTELDLVSTADHWSLIPSILQYESSIFAN